MQVRLLKPADFCWLSRAISAGNTSHCSVTDRYGAGWRWSMKRLMAAEVVIVGSQARGPVLCVPEFKIGQVLLGHQCARNPVRDGATAGTR